MSDGTQVNAAGERTYNGLTFGEHLDALAKICNQLLADGDLDGLKECFAAADSRLLVHVLQIHMTALGGTIPPELLVGPRHPSRIRRDPYAEPQVGDKCIWEAADPDGVVAPEKFTARVVAMRTVNLGQELEVEVEGDQRTPRYTWFWSIDQWQRQRRPPARWERGDKP